ncbi:hypothetical protein [Marivita sp.]|uniref:hypothetical protein n=1 Tax=Marivita sp. TaxID=2003365 RepID=UPI0025BBE810|nr:hypothetical protein [Marivita sp.]
MFKLYKSFVENEDGAVTVDWVILTAAVVGIAFGAMMLFQENVTTVSDATGATLSDYNDSLEW